MKDNDRQRLPGQLKTGRLNKSYRTDPLQRFGSGRVGEIGLLRRLPRTATVRAAYRRVPAGLTCKRFLPVVTGFPPSAREARTSVEEMLDRFSPNEPTHNQSDKL
jgi:hypothetical protein